MKNVFIFILILILIIIGIFVMRYYAKVGNLLQNEGKRNIISIKHPVPNQKITNPLLVSGKARGWWFFEAEFPIKVFDEKGDLLGMALARADQEWMTDDFVDFFAQINFKPPSTQKGFIVLEKSNPSGLSENADYFIIPIKFN